MTNAALEKLCEQIVTARTEKKLTPEKVASAIRFDENYIVALEAGDLAALPQGYARMFYRSYLKFLNLDTEENFELLAMALGKLPDSNPVAEKKEDTSKSKRPSEAAKHITWLPIILVIALLVYFSIDYISSKSEVEAPVKEVTVEDAKLLIDTVTVDSSKIIPQAKSDSISLTLHARGPVFVLAKLDSINEFKRTIRDTSDIVIWAKEHINLYVSEGSRLGVTFQDTTISALSAPDVRVNYMIFTPAGVGKKGLARKKIANDETPLPSN